MFRTNLAITSCLLVALTSPRVAKAGKPVQDTRVTSSFAGFGVNTVSHAAAKRPVWTLRKYEHRSLPHTEFW